mmetsp:Transcript_16059/g.54742  ORF Transcript_16059/g.54742 Transcript_16059/m.54742 type:complete len:383 (+) Transcript_16059:558-1706(+)
MDFSMSWMSFSWRRSSSLCRSFMRWISFFIAATTSLPTSGSSTACVSFSSWILRSHSMIWRSLSTTSARISRFSSEHCEILLSSFAASCSSSLSWLTMLFSRLKLSFASVSWSVVFFAMSWLRRCMSLCMRSVLESRSLISFWCTECCWSRRVRFCVSTVCSLFRRCTFSASALFSFIRLTSSVWNTTHRRWSSLPSTSLALSSRFRLVMVASSGPMFSSVMFAVSLSYWRFRWSTSFVFFSISSLRRLISSSYFSIVLPFSLSSSSRALSVSLSLPLCACVLRMSTRTFASSFWSVVTCISSLRICWRRFCVLCTVLDAVFSVVIWSPRLTRIFSSTCCIAWDTFTISLSRLSSELSRCSFSLAHSSALASVCSREACSLT